MKNFKKVLFGVLAMLVMVTGVSAVSQNDTYYEDNNIKNEAALKACFEAAKEEYVTCTLAGNVKMNSNLISATEKVTLNLNNYKITFDNQYGIAVNKGHNVTINGGTIEFNTGWINEYGNLTINNTTLSSTGTTGALVNIGGATVTSGKIAVTLNNVTASNEKGGIVEVATSTAVPVTLNISGTYTSTGNVVTVSVAKVADVTLTGTYTSEAAVYGGSGAVKTLKVNEGTYTSVSQTFKLVGGEITFDGAKINSESAGIATFNAPSKIVVKNATIDGDGAAITATISGDEVTIENGTYTSKGNVVDLKDATLKIVNGTFTNTNKGRVINTTGASNVTIENGTYTTEGTDALYLDGTTTAKINDGHFKATGTVVQSANNGILYGGAYEGNNESNATLINLTNRVAAKHVAVRIGDVVYVGEGHKLYIQITDRTNGVVSKADNAIDNMLAGHTYTFEDIKDYLKVKANEGYVVKYELVYGDDDEKTGVVTEEGFTMPDEDAKLIVSFVQASVNPDNQGDPVEDPGTTTNPGDETTNKNPGTFDGIASFVTLAVSSLGAAGYSIKKVIKR